MYEGGNYGNFVGKVIRVGGEYYLLRVCYEVVGIIRKNLITFLEFFNSYCRVMVCF